jgi:hypothetical protein
VEDKKISSLATMSDMSGADEELVRFILEELVDEGTLEGTFTIDGQRFFLSEVKVSAAPVASSKDGGYFIEKKDIKIPRLVLITGVAIMVVGYIVRGLLMIADIMEQIGGAIFMIGLAVMITGWIMISRANLPSNIR